MLVHRLQRMTHAKHRIAIVATRGRERRVFFDDWSNTKARPFGCWSPAIGGTSEPPSASCAPPSRAPSGCLRLELLRMNEWNGSRVAQSERRGSDPRGG